MNGSDHLLLTLAGTPERSGSNGLAARLRDRVEGRGGVVVEQQVDDVTSWKVDIPTAG